AMPTVVVTGANGFIGSHLVRHFSRQQWRVVALCRAAPTTDRDPHVSYPRFSLGDAVQPQDLEGGDYLLHFAGAPYSGRSAGAHDLNIRGTQRLLDLSRELRFKRFVFLSSLSAHTEAQSHYGRHKFILESRCDPQRDLVLRPGLTLGNGGLARSLADSIRKLR